MFTPDTQPITSTNTKETPKCNKINSTFSQSTPFIRRLLSLKIMIFLMVLISMMQTYLLFSISSTQDTHGRYKDGTDVQQEVSSKRVSVNPKRRLGLPLKAPTKVYLTKPKLKKPSKKPVSKPKPKTKKKVR